MKHLSNIQKALSEFSVTLAVCCLLAGVLFFSEHDVLAADVAPAVRLAVVEAEGNYRVEVQSEEGRTIWRAPQEGLWSIATFVALVFYHRAVDGGAE